MPEIRRYAKMLHWSIHFFDISDSDIVSLSCGNVETDAGDRGSGGEVHYTDYEREVSREQLLLQCVRDGNPDYGDLMEELLKSELLDDYRTGNPLREAQDAVLMFTVLCCRAVIDGGVSVKEAKDLELRTVRSLEAARSITQVQAIRREVLAEAVRCVQAIRHRPELSPQVRSCCAYIRAHLRDEIRLEDMAKNVGYTEYYLSRKFQRETGEKIGDYIRRERLGYAKVLLITTGKDIQEICDELHFGTRNYFSRVFKAQEGVMPAEYRKRLPRA